MLVLAVLYWLAAKPVPVRVDGLNETTFTVVGVTPPGFHGPQALIALDVFIPVSMQATLIPGDRLAARGSGWPQGLRPPAPGPTLHRRQGRPQGVPKEEASRRGAGSPPPAAPAGVGPTPRR